MPEFRNYDWLKILLVEDEQEARELYKETLEFVFPNVTTAANGAEGLELFRVQQPHIVIGDIKMPIMSGLEFAGLQNRSKRGDHLCQRCLLRALRLLA